MAYTLVVIDMQEIFKSATHINPLVGVTREVMIAKTKKYPILYVEFDEARTLSQLTNLVKKYSKYAKVMKRFCDGSSDIIRALRRKNFPNNKLRICGVNSDACVLDTVKGLLKKLPDSKIEVVTNACASSKANKISGDDSYEWDDFVTHPNLLLV